MRIHKVNYFYPRSGNFPQISLINADFFCENLRYLRETLLKRQTLITLKQELKLMKFNTKGFFNLVDLFRNTNFINNFV